MDGHTIHGKSLKVETTRDVSRADNNNGNNNRSGGDDGYSRVKKDVPVKFADTLAAGKPISTPSAGVAAASSEASESMTRPAKPTVSPPIQEPRLTANALGGDDLMDDVRFGSALDDLLNGSLQGRRTAPSPSITSTLKAPTSPSHSSIISNTVDPRALSSSDEDLDRLLGSQAVGGDMFAGMDDGGGLLVRDSDGVLRDLFAMREQALLRMRIEDGDVDWSAALKAASQSNGGITGVMKGEKPVTGDAYSDQMRSGKEKMNSRVDTRSSGNDTNGDAIGTEIGFDRTTTTDVTTESKKASSNRSSRIEDNASIWEQEMQELNETIIDVPTPMDDAAAREPQP
jgi:hypothetical protein